jgi:hypothetical protein
LDGSGAENLVTQDLVHPGGIALDLQRGKMYWTDVEGNLDGRGKIQRSDLDGLNVETLITGVDEAYGLDLDAVSGKIYWPDLATGRIQRANLDGSGVEDLVLGLDTPTDVSLDVDQGKMYWTDSGFGDQINRIQRANLDGSGAEVIVSDLGFPWGIANQNCPGDITGDGITDQVDLGILLALWGYCEGDPYYDPSVDLNGDGCINQPDLGILLAGWGCGL